MDADQKFEVFGDRAHFAFEVRHMPNVSTDYDPEASEGSWGEWRLWVADKNLCAFHLESDDEDVEIREVQWYLAPLFEWLVANWIPLLHEKRLPVGGCFVDGRPRSARAAYLSMLETAGDDLDRFDTWQIWAERHALCTAAEGGIVPDVFFQRMEDEIEISWGDRTQPGADAATFFAEDSVARVSADKVAQAFYSAIEWFSKLPEVQQFTWCEVLSREWDKVKSLPAGQSALSWYLDGSPEREP